MTVPQRDGITFKEVSQVASQELSIADHQGGQETTSPEVTTTATRFLGVKGLLGASVADGHIHACQKGFAMPANTLTQKYQIQHC